MDPTQDIFYLRRKFKSVSPSRRIVSNSDNEQDLEYVPPGATNPTPSVGITRGTAQKVVPHVDNYVWELVELSEMLEPTI